MVGKGSKKERVVSQTALTFPVTPGIEMMKQDAYGEEVEREDSDAEMQHLTGTSNLIAEGDLDSQSDDEVSSGDGCIPFVMSHWKEECTPRNIRSFVVGKLKSGVAKLKMLLALMCDRRVLFSIVLCGLVSCTAVTSSEVCIPVVTLYGTCSDVVIRKAYVLAMAA